MEKAETIQYKPYANGSMPREKIQSSGIHSISDEELITVLLGSGVKGNPVYEIAHEIVSLLDEKDNNIALEDLLAIKGLGKAKALAIISTLELGRRIFQPRKRKVTSPHDLLPLLAHYADREQECFLSFSLNGANEVIVQHVVSVGLLNKTLIHPREIFRKAIIHNAASIIVAHNHPSGNISPSDEDLAVTKKIVSAGNMLDIQVLDHIIFTDKAHFSFLGNKLM